MLKNYFNLIFFFYSANTVNFGRILYLQVIKLYILSCVKIKEYLSKIINLTSLGPINLNSCFKMQNRTIVNKIASGKKEIDLAFMCNELSQKKQFSICTLCLYNIQRENLVLKNLSVSRKKVA